MFDELADGVFRRQYDFLRLNIGVILGEDGALVIDSRESHEAAEELAADIRSLTPKPVRWVVNTHWHWDHTFGNAVFSEADIWGHRVARSRLVNDPDGGRSDARNWMPASRHGEIDRVEIVPPSHTFEAVASIDVGTHTIELAHHGRGHTDNDIVIHVDDVTFMGDLVEEGHAPFMGDAYLLDWPSTLAAVEPTAGRQIVPGHGGIGDHQWLVGCRHDMELVADRLRDVLYEGRSVEDAVRHGPFGEADMHQALGRGIAWAGGIDDLTPWDG